MGRYALWGLGFLLLLLVGGRVLDLVVMVAFAPWALDWAGRPTLVGTWEGPLHARLGSEYRLLLTLTYDAPDEGFPRIGGIGRLCTANGDAYNYVLSGDSDRSGDHVRLGLGYRDGSLSQLGFGLDARWAGESLHLLRASDNPFQPDGSFDSDRASSTGDPDDRFEPAELHRATTADFEAACGQLRRR